MTRRVHASRMSWTASSCDGLRSSDGRSRCSARSASAGAADAEKGNADEKTGEKDASALPNFAHQAAALFVSGYATIVKGDPSQEAKPKLSKALKLAHTQCCNHQLVAQSLALIGTSNSGE